MASVHFHETNQLQTEKSQKGPNLRDAERRRIIGLRVKMIPGKKEKRKRYRSKEISKGIEWKKRKRKERKQDDLI